MNSRTVASSMTREPMADHTGNPEYDALPEAVKMKHTPQQFAWLGDERYRLVERETQPDFEVIE